MRSWPTYRCSACARLDAGALQRITQARGTPTLLTRRLVERVHARSDIAHHPRDAVEQTSPRERAAALHSRGYASRATHVYESKCKNIKRIKEQDASRRPPYLYFPVAILYAVQTQRSLDLLAAQRARQILHPDHAPASAATKPRAAPACSRTRGGKSLPIAPAAAASRTRPCSRRDVACRRNLQPKPAPARDWLMPHEAPGHLLTYQRVRLLEVVAPVGPQALLPTHIPKIQLVTLKESQYSNTDQQLTRAPESPWS